MPDIRSKFQKDPSITFRVILLTYIQTDKQTNKQTKTGKNITLLAEVITNVMCHIAILLFPFQVTVALEL